MGIVVGQDLLAEKNLWQIYKSCVGLLTPSSFNFRFTALIFLCLVCEVAYFPQFYQQRIDMCKSLSELGLGFGSTILGFLIAGFTIFSTLSKPELFLRLQQTIHKASGLSYLKVNFFTFVEVFVVYIFFMIICLAVKVFGGKYGLVSSIIEFSIQKHLFGYYLDKQWIANTGYVLFTTLAFFSLLALKSFIFNTYHTVMTSVVWSFNPPKPLRKNILPSSRARK
jgi:hypothetical protein